MAPHRRLHRAQAAIMAPPELMDDLVAEILLRLPPDDPACLVRAALVCKPWRRLLSDAGFLHRYRAFHRTPPMLGFLRNLDESNEHLAVFVPTSAFRPRDPGRRNWYALDSRHGRVLLHTLLSGVEEEKPMELIVWDPMTAGQWGLRKPDVPHFHFNATVLCAAAGGGCEHRDCHGGPFLVAAACSFEAGFALACVYSSETGAWSAPASVLLGCRVEMKPSALVGDALYFICDDGALILEYDMGARGLSVIRPPAIYDGEIVLMPAEDGGLGFAGVEGSSLYLWSRETEPDGVAAWAQRRVIDVGMMLPVTGTLNPTDVIGFAEGAGITIFVGTDAGVFTVELKSGQVNKVCEKGIYADYAVFPYTSFYIPDGASG